MNLSDWYATSAFATAGSVARDAAVARASMTPAMGTSPLSAMACKASSVVSAFSCSPSATSIIAEVA